LPTPAVTVRNNMVIATTDLPGLIIRYTTDGSEPTGSSNEYKAPIELNKDIKLRAFSRSGRGGGTIGVEKN
jgi:hexosaminidase